mgnify:CR=1 FL=1
MKKPTNLCHQCLYRGQQLLCPFTDFMTERAFQSGNVEIFVGYIGYDLSKLLKDVNMKGHCGNVRLPKEIPDELLTKVRSWLDGNGGREFFTLVKQKHGRVDAVWEDDGFPYSVHFNEGMKVRNFIRGTGLVDDWNSCDLDDMWIEIIEKALGI